MIQGTTPTLELALEDETIDLGLAAHVYATLRQGGRKLTKSGADLEIEGNIARVWLSQEETLAFDAIHRVEVQLNWTYPGGARAASESGSFEVKDNLLPEVLTT